MSANDVTNTTVVMITNYMANPDKRNDTNSDISQCGYIKHQRS